MKWYLYFYQHCQQGQRSRFQPQSGPCVRVEKCLSWKIESRCLLLCISAVLARVWRAVLGCHYLCCTVDGLDSGRRGGGECLTTSKSVTPVFHLIAFGMVLCHCTAMATTIAVLILNLIPILILIMMIMSVFTLSSRFRIILILSPPPCNHVSLLPRSYLPSLLPPVYRPCQSPFVVSAIFLS